MNYQPGVCDRIGIMWMMFPMVMESSIYSLIMKEYKLDYYPVSMFGTKYYYEFKCIMQGIRFMDQ